VGSVAVRGAAFGFVYAIGGGAFGPAIIDGRRGDEAARLFIDRWLGEGMLPPTCRGDPHLTVIPREADTMARALSHGTDGDGPF